MKEKEKTIRARIEKLKNQIADPDTNVYDGIRARNALEVAQQQLRLATGSELERLTDAGIAADDELGRILETPISA